MKYLFLTALLILSTPLAAQTGILYDRTLRGEGITVFEHEGFDKVPFRTFYFYTYGDDQCEIDSYNVDHHLQREVVAEAIAECPNSIFPPFKPLCDPVVVKVTEVLNEIVTLPAADIECNQDGQRWFVASDPIVQKTDGEGIEAGDSIGKFYATNGMDYPHCVPSNDPFEEDVDICGVPEQVGNYILRPDGDGGFLMWVQEPEQVNPLLDGPKDPLFDRTYFFDTPLVVIGEVAEPK